MNPPSNNIDPKTIVEKLLILLVILIAAVLTGVGGTVFEHLGASTAGGRFEALPMLGISLVMGHDYAPDTIRAAVYVGGYLIYFLIGLYLLTVVQNWIKKNKGGGPKGGGGTRI
jgi:hypothetical protein